jgi:hypothetical protein
MIAEPRDIPSSCGSYILTRRGHGWVVRTIDEAVETVASLLDAARREETRGNRPEAPEGGHYFERRAAELERAIIKARTGQHQEATCQVSA